MKNLDFSPIYYNRGRIHYQLGKYDKALFDFNRAIELNPNAVDAYWWRSRTYGLQNNYELEITDF